MAAIELHPDVAPLAFLLGTWAGDGQGSYPTIETFAYREEVTFGHVGKPFVSYVQRSRLAATGLPAHSESGYYRMAGARGIELVLAQPSGIVEVHEGTLNGTSFALRTVQVLTTATAKSVTAVERLVEVVDGFVMRYELRMAAMGQPLQHHLAAELRRVEQ